MINKIRTPIIILLLSSPLIFIDLYTKYLSHQHITSEDKEIVITQNIAITVPLINKGWVLQDPNTVTKLTTITKNIAKNLGIISSSKTIHKSLEEILDELYSSIENGKDISKYLINLAVFLGLIGTFYGLLLTIGSVSNVIDGLSIEQQDFGVFFDSLKNGLKSPLSGMTIAFSSSLFGLVTSLILGLYEIITKGIKQTYFEFCESQIRLYYKASSKLKSASNNNDNSELISKLSELVEGINKINNNFSNSNEEIKKEISSEIKDLSKSIKDLVKK